MSWMASFLIALFLPGLQISALRGGVFGGVTGEQITTLTIQSNGVCILTQEFVQPRTQIEMQIKSRERYAAFEEGEVMSDTEAAPVQPPVIPLPEQSPSPDADLISKVRKMYQARSGSAEENEAKVERVEVGSNTVRVVTSRTFATLKQLASQSPWSWAPYQLRLDNALFETDTNRNLRVVLTTDKRAAADLQTMLAQWGNAKTVMEWRLAFPGNVLESGLPERTNNVTRLRIDTGKKESLEALAKLYAGPIVIVAEAKGLALPGPLNTKSLVQSAARRMQAEPEIPITDAGPGFIAEALNLTINTTHRFSGEKDEPGTPGDNGEEVLAPDLAELDAVTAADLQALDGGMMPGEDSSEGVVVTAQLFPPRDRMIKSLTDVRITRAVDDKGRAVPTPAETNSAAAQMRWSSYGGQANAGVNFSLRLALPEPDAQSIEDIECEAIALTLGDWKSVTLTNLQADPKKEIDLNELVPGAKLIIRKLETKNRQTVEARVEGPLEIRLLDFRLVSGKRKIQGSSYSDRPGTETGAKTSRQITVNAYDYNISAGGGSLGLEIRFPRDSKRERVRFKLTALDLL